MMTRTKLIGTFLLSTAVCATTGLAANFGSPLYDTLDPVHILDSSNFHRELRKAPKAYLVQFYNSWCGHCIRFAPTFKEFAAEVRGWYPTLDVGVVNCADSLNGQLCSDNDISGFPTIKIFWIESGSRRNTTGKTLMARDPDLLMASVVNFIEAKYKESGKPQGFPTLDSSSANTLEEIWASFPDHIKHIYAVVEAPGSFCGRELTLDFSAVNDTGVVRFIRGSGPEELRNQDSVSLIRLEKQIHPTIFATEPDASKARALFKKKLAEIGILLNKNKSSSIVATKRPHLVIGNYSKIYLDDIETGIAYTLKQEIALKHVISSKQLGILKSFLQLLSECADLSGRIKNYLQNVVQAIDVSQPLTSSRYLRLLEKAKTSDGYLLTNTDYVGCRGSIPGKRGYTCSLWTLLHLATVGSHERFLQNQTDNPNSAVLVVRDYIMNFFSCSECTAHFKLMSENLESKLTSPDESVLWLWRSHNEVNARLKGDITEDPERPKVQFPPASLCPECHNGVAFNESLVLKFLHRFYDSTNMIASDEFAALGVTERFGRSNQNTKYFSGFDLTIFLVIYAVSITLLFVVFVAMVCRRRKGHFNNRTFSSMYQ